MEEGQGFWSITHNTNTVAVLLGHRMRLHTNKRLSSQCNMLYSPFGHIDFISVSALAFGYWDFYID